MEPQETVLRFAAEVTATAAAAAAAEVAVAVARAKLAEARTSVACVAEALAAAEADVRATEAKAAVAAKVATAAKSEVEALTAARALWGNIGAATPIPNRIIPPRTDWGVADDLLEAVTSSEVTIVVGDRRSGKSTIMQHLIADWVSVIQTPALVILVSNTADVSGTWVPFVDLHMSETSADVDSPWQRVLAWQAQRFRRYGARAGCIVVFDDAAVTDGPHFANILAALRECNAQVMVAVQHWPRKASTILCELVRVVIATDRVYQDDARLMLGGTVVQRNELMRTTRFNGPPRQLLWKFWAGQTAAAGLPIALTYKAAVTPPHPLVRYSAFAGDDEQREFAALMAAPPIVGPIQLTADAVLEVLRIKSKGKGKA